MKTNTAQKIEITPQIVKEHGLSADEYQRILGIMGREPNMVELGIFSVMWSEHCSYKTTRMHLRGMPTEAPWVICGPGENAGVIDIGDGQAAIFKMESHNHPSFIEPFQGAATGVGGILRDVFTMGARPIANMNALRFGDPSHPKTKHLVAGVVAGIGAYGNCVGVPTVGGECNFHPRYNGNILVNAMTVGIAATDKIFYSKAAGVGNPVVYVGSKTGRDGIHGATMASAEFDANSEEKRPTVQVGDPFTEKLLIEACLELMATDAIIAIQDMGAAGLTSSSFEMAGKGDLGIRLDLEKVPMREDGMTPYEIMLSESQERMLMILKPEKYDMAKAIFDKWELDFATIGVLTDSGKMELFMHGEQVASMPIAPISVDAPMYDRPYEIKRIADSGWRLDETLPATREPLPATLKKLLSSPDLASRRWIWEQYDSQVGNDTVARPGGDASVVRVHGTQKALAISTDCNPRYCEADPVMGGRQAVVETWRNIVATGARPLAITNCLNFGNPEKPEVMGQIVGCLKGMSEACIGLDYPIISGNVSLYNDTEGKSILPTPAIGGVGLLKNVNERVGNAFVVENEVILLIGETKGHLAQSQYQRYILGVEEGPVPPVDVALERKHGEFILAQMASKKITACHDVSDGGLLVAIVEMCSTNLTPTACGRGKGGADHKLSTQNMPPPLSPPVNGGGGANLFSPQVGGVNVSVSQVIGATITLPADIHAVAAAFGEDQARYIITVKTSDADAILKEAAAQNIPCAKLGTTGGDALLIEGHGAIAIAELKISHERFLPEYMSA